ncbi:amidase [Rhizobium leguminosarum]|uniref:amidase n=1 Tax=Rhizobium leguminosarum TaxID=384 RepID=UPI00103AC8CC|nr:amidase [Rhizobium leguminosarum]MBY5494233.1 amidase [Rhizobium leguminosarum]NKK46906.1 amidase [Rhizobium leguminosarum bv. viciae]TBZ40474.1 amidase [Rhizobium leguminosarum bv. viciae]TCA06450.1 amidase [Rhizobium leguminosarum bv. viciae]TCA19658.1 amidase [Rhizobium leguminosarum bv. viciae]
MLEKPTNEDLQRIAAANGFAISEDDTVAFARSIENSLASYLVIEELSGENTTHLNRDKGRRPTAAENKFGAWAWTCSIRTATDGPLAGKKIAIKDNISVAGLPLLNGSEMLEGYVAQTNATVVTRILAAGGEIVGKAVSENLCFSGGSHTSYPGPVLNPIDPTRMAGGSSSGNASLLAANECDIAIGGDQGGSVRIPGSWSGVIGLKPTWGLVPYTGAFPIEPSLDHLGPMAHTVKDIALTLDVIAGRDGLDARQINTPFNLQSYAKSLDAPKRGIRIGILKEGFGWEGLSDPAVDEAVRQAAAHFSRLGATVSEVSVPYHVHGLDIWTGIATEGAWNVMIRDNVIAYGSQGYQDIDFIEFYRDAKDRRADLFSPTVKGVILLGQYLTEKAGGSYYAKAQNLRRRLRSAYDDALASVDVLVMPTTPMIAPKLEPAATLSRYMEIALNMMPNTATFDATGHPALTIPCGFVDGMPVGMMLVGRHHDEATVLYAAKLFEDR